MQMVLFGSRPRGDSEPGSDIDVLVFLKNPVHPGDEIDRTIHIMAELSLQYAEVMSCIFIGRCGAIQISSWAAAAQYPDRSVASYCRRTTHFKTCRLGYPHAMNRHGNREGEPWRERPRRDGRPSPCWRRLTPWEERSVRQENFRQHVGVEGDHASGSASRMR